MLIPVAPAYGHRITHIYMLRGAFNEAHDHVREAAAAAPSQASITRLSAIAREIDMTSGPMEAYEEEHLLRLALEGILEAIDSARADWEPDLDQLAPVLEAMLLRFDAYESAQLRRTSIELGSRMLDSAEWRSALQRRGQGLIEEQRDTGGLPDGDTTEEIIALVEALARTGDSRMITLIDTLRRGTRRREIVTAARDAIDRLDGGQ